MGRARRDLSCSRSGLPAIHEKIFARVFAHLPAIAKNFEKFGDAFFALLAALEHARERIVSRASIPLRRYYESSDILQYDNLLT